jgi:hypothetical protein
MSLVVRIAHAALVSALVFGSAMPAQADDETLRTSLRTANGAIRSIQVAGVEPGDPLLVVETFVAPHRSSVVLASVATGADGKRVISTTVEMRRIDGSVYVRVPGKEWAHGGPRFAYPRVAEAVLDLSQPIVFLPDETDGAVTYGVYRTTVDYGASGQPPKPTEQTCRYDKATYRIHRCFGAGLNLTVIATDAPALAVGVPLLSANAPTARDVSIGFGPTPFQRNLADAAAALSSFVVTLKSDSGQTNVATIVRPARVSLHEKLGMSDRTFDLRLVDGVEYGNDGAGWKVGHQYAADAAKMIRLANLLMGGAGAQQLADESVGDATYYAFQYPNASKAAATHCLAEKATYRVISCRLDIGTISFAHFDESTNAVEKPEVTGGATPSP